MLYPAVISPNQIIPNGRDIFSLSRLPCLSHLIVWLELERWPREETSLRFRIQTSLDMGGNVRASTSRVLVRKYVGLYGVY